MVLVLALQTTLRPVHLLALLVAEVLRTAQLVVIVLVYPYLDSIALFCLFVRSVLVAPLAELLQLQPVFAELPYILIRVIVQLLALCTTQFNEVVL